MHSPDYRTMERKDMLQAEIDAGLSRIDSTVASFITKSQKLTTNSTVQELIRMKHQLAILVEEVDYNIKSIDDNRKRLLDMEFYKWPIEYVSRFDIVHRRYFRMKACMTELVDKIESANAMSGSAATIIIKEETVVKTETTDTLTEESITDSSNGIDENRDKSISNNCHHAATTFANVQTTETRTTPTKEEEPLKQINSTEVLNKSGENRRKHRIIEPRIRSQSKDKTPINSPEQQNRSQRASSSPVKKKSKKSAKPLIIPTERTSSVQIVPPAPAVFDPRSKSYQMWKQAANASQKPVGTVPLQSYAIPSDMSRFKNDFQKQREQVERGSQIEHVTLTVVSPPINTEDSITAAKQMERTKAVQDEKKTSRATSVDKNPSPINSTYEENDSYKLEKVAAPGQSSICQANITQTSSQQTKPILKVEKTREKKEEEDDDSDIELTVMEKYFINSKAHIYALQLKAIDIQSKLNSTSNKHASLDMLHQEGVSCVQFYAWAGNEIMKIFEYCSGRQHMYQLLFEKLSSENQHYVQFLSHSIDGLIEVTETTYFLYKTVTSDIDKMINLLLPHEKYALFEKLAFVEEKNDLCSQWGKVYEDQEVFDFMRIQPKDFHQKREHSSSINPPTIRTMGKTAAENSFNIDVKTTQRICQSSREQTSHKDLIIKNHNSYSEITYHKLNDSKKKLITWDHTQLTKTFNEPIRDWNNLLEEYSKDLLKYFRGNPKVTSVSFISHDGSITQADNWMKKMADILEKNFIDSVRIVDQEEVLNREFEKESMGASRSKDNKDDWEVECDIDCASPSSDSDYIESEEPDSDRQASLVDHDRCFSSSTDEGTVSENTEDTVDTELLDDPPPRKLPFRAARIQVNKTPLFSAYSLLTEDDLDCDGSSLFSSRKGSRSPSLPDSRPSKLMKLTTAV